jgi:hypothetical protein
MPPTGVSTSVRVPISGITPSCQQLSCHHHAPFGRKDPPSDIQLDHLSLTHLVHKTRQEGPALDAEGNLRACRVDMNDKNCLNIYSCFASASPRSCGGRNGPRQSQIAELSRTPSSFQLLAGLTVFM